MRTRIVAMGLVLVFLSSSAFALIGPPTAGLEQGQFSIGYDYTYSDMDLDDTGFDNIIWLDGAIVDVFTEETEVTDVITQRHYASIHYGATDQWEAYFKIGMADMKAKTYAKGDVETLGLNFDNDIAWGFGTKYTLSEQDGMCWGITAQMNWLDTSTNKPFTEVDPGTTYTGTIDVDIETYDLLIAVGPTIDMGGWTLYGGPFYYMLDGDLEACGSGTGGGSLIEIEVDGDLEEASSFGGFVGAQFGVYENCNMAIEFFGTGDGWGAGAGIEIPF